MEESFMSIHKASLGPHYGSILNSKTFEEAYAFIKAHPDQKYVTTGNSTPFIAKANCMTKGAHQNERVIRFYSRGKQMAVALRCCWGHKTNCYATHIDCYTQAL
jgi:hypothetical protein